MPLLQDLRNESIAQIMTDEFYFKFISETLEAMGEERSKPILSKLYISHGVTRVKDRIDTLHTKLNSSDLQYPPRKDRNSNISYNLNTRNVYDEADVFGLQYLKEQPIEIVESPDYTPLTSQIQRDESEISLPLTTVRKRDEKMTQKLKEAQ